MSSRARYHTHGDRRDPVPSTDDDDENAAVGAVFDDTWDLISDVLLERILGFPRYAEARIRAGS
jgi:hypothetical protein